MATITSETVAGDFIRRWEDSGGAKQTGKRGLIRWLRPESQNRSGASATQGHLGLAPAEKTAKPKKADKLLWPKSLAEQAQAVRAALGTEAGPATRRTLAAVQRSESGSCRRVAGDAHGARASAVSGR